MAVKKVDGALLISDLVDFVNQHKSFTFVIL